MSGMVTGTGGVRVQMFGVVLLAVAAFNIISLPRKCCGRTRALWARPSEARQSAIAEGDAPDRSECNPYACDVSLELKGECTDFAWGVHHGCCYCGRAATARLCANFHRVRVTEVGREYSQEDLLPDPRKSGIAICNVTLHT
jgi:hypothetical protein